MERTNKSKGNFTVFMYFTIIVFLSSHLKKKKKWYLKVITVGHFR